MSSTPMIVVPQIIEQKLNGMRVEELGVGRFNKDVDELEADIANVKKDYEKHLINLKKAKGSFKENDSFENVFEKIHGLIEKSDV